MIIYSQTGKNIDMLDEANKGIIPDFPNHFASTEERKSEKWIKQTLDFYKRLARENYEYKYKEYKGNYALMNGEIDAKYLYQEMRDDIDYKTGGLMNLVEGLDEDVDERGLPNWVRHFSIIMQPVNSMLGELSSRPDFSLPKAVDDLSKSEYFQFLTDLMEQKYVEVLKKKLEIKMTAEANGQPIDKKKLSEEINQRVAQSLKEEVSGYSTAVEKWAAFLVESCKLEFEMKDKSEIAAKDLLATSSEFYEIYEAKNNTGFDIKVLNPITTWQILPKDEKYTKNAVASGYITEMTLHEIVNRFTLDSKDIEHLKDEFAGKGIKRGGVEYIKESHDNLRFPMATELFNPIMDYDNRTNKFNFNAVDYKKQTFTVTVSYFQAFKKIGRLGIKEKFNDLEVESFLLVDDTYKSGEHHNQSSLEWTYDTQWMMGYTIGDYVYGMSELEMLDYCPIIGVIHNNRNTKARSFVDMLKPFASVYDLMLNQIWNIASKEYGVVFMGEKNHIPHSQDQDNYDAIDDFLFQMKENGVAFPDTSIKNTKVATMNTNVFKAVDLTRSNEMITRLNIAQAIKEEAHSIVGINRQRLGGLLASDTVGGTNIARSASYAQTEPIFIQHEYVLNQLYQAIVDAGLYISQERPESTLSFINSEGTSIFFKIDAYQLRSRDVKLFFTSRSKDYEAFQSMKGLAAPFLQSGGDLYDVSLLYSTNSFRGLQEVYKRLKERREQMEEQGMMMKQQEMEMLQQEKQEAIKREMKIHQDNLNIKKYEIDTKARTALDTRRIENFYRDPGGDYDNVEGPDAQSIYMAALKKQQFEEDRYNAGKKIEQKEMEINLKQDINNANLRLKEKELDLKREDIETKKYIARINKNKYDQSNSK